MFHSIWRIVAHALHLSRPARPDRSLRQSRLALETLEDRWLPSASTIGGFVYADANNNGIMDSGETGIPGSTIELHRADGSLVATTTADAKGHFSFSTDPSINTTPQTKEVDATFTNAPTDWTNAQSVAQFDPSLGTLTSVEIISDANLSTHVQVENAAPLPAQPSQPANADVQVTGHFLVTANGATLLQSSTGVIDNSTTLGPFDGTSDFQGADSFDFGAKSSTASGSVTLDASSKDLSAFIGTATVQLNETASVSSTDSGNGNFDERIRSQADGNVKIIYHYVPSTGLRPGDYFVKQVTEPAGFLDGQTTNDNVHPILNSFGVNRIDVHLDAGQSSVNNNFAEVPPAALSGFVFHDLNDNHVKDPNEPGLGGVTVTLTGTNALGQSVNLTQVTNPDGSYSFTGLWAGTNYTLTETTQPSGGFLSPSEQVGSQGGVAGASAIDHINLGTGVSGVNNNFGHVLPSSLSGFVYVDAGHTGARVPTDPPLADVGITLTGTDDQGNQVSIPATTQADGSYRFTGLRPGTYTISEAPPPGFVDGVATPGSLGGTAGIDQLFVQIGENQNGINYNFGALTAPANLPPLTPQAPGNPVPPPGPAPISKDLFVGNDWLNWIPM
jgi:hypothetical protein